MGGSSRWWWGSMENDGRMIGEMERTPWSRQDEGDDCGVGNKA